MTKFCPRNTKTHQFFCLFQTNHGIVYGVDEYHKKYFQHLTFNFFHVCLMRGLQKYARISMIAVPIQPIWQHFLTLSWSAFEVPSGELTVLDIFAIPSSSRHEKVKTLSNIRKTLLIVWYSSTL